MINLLSHKVKLLPKQALVPTSPIDHPYWNFRPLLGTIQRLRFRIVLELLGRARFGRLLEIGYGSGLFLPSLAERCDELYGVDPHVMRKEVERCLADHGVPATLATARLESLPYETGFFDCAVAVSTLEYVPDIATACQELRRVLRPGGLLVVSTPGATRLWDLPLHLLTREGPDQYADRRRQLQPSLRSQFTVVREVRIPPMRGNAVRLYTGLCLRAD